MFDWFKSKLKASRFNSDKVLADNENYSEFVKRTSGESMEQSILSRNTFYEKKSSLRFFYTIIAVETIILLAVLGAGGWYYWKNIYSQPQDKKIEIPKSIVEGMKVEVGSFDTYINTIGTLKANQTVIIRPEMEGKIEEILFTSGEKVNASDPLIKLYDEGLAAAVKEAKFEVELWKGKSERAKILLEKQAGSAKDKEEASAQLQVMEARLERAQYQLSKATLSAPFDGIVGFKDVHIGSYVRAGEDLVTIDDTESIKIEFRLAEGLGDKIEVGQKIKVEIDGFNDNVFEATVEAVDTNIDPLGHSLRVRAILDNKDDLFKPGLFVKVKMMISSRDNVLMVPESAVESRGNQEFVYTVEKGHAKYTPIRTGGRNGEKAEIISGLKPDQIVIIAGQMKVQDKYPVMVVPPHALKRFQ